MHTWRLAALLVVLTAAPAAAQDWPSRPVTIINPFAAGASVDNVARVIAQDLSEKFGQPFSIDNRSGAGGAIGSAAAAKAAPDGYTLLMTAIGPAVLNQLMSKSVAYNTDKDFTPVILIGEIPQLIVASPKLGFRTLRELIEFGRNNPGKLNIGHAGAGSMGHLTGLLFLARTEIKGTLITYRGSMPLVTDLIGGQIEAGVPIYLPPARKTTILAVASAQRVPFLPDVPTTAEGGVDLIASTWMALFAPAGTPPDIVAKLNMAINRYMATPEGKTQFTNQGMRQLGGTPADLANAVKRDRALWGPIIEKEAIKPEGN